MLYVVYVNTLYSILIVCANVEYALVILIHRNLATVHV